MSAIARLFTDPAWWVGVVVVGILCSLFASYLRDWLETLGSHMSGPIKRFVTARREKRNARIEVLSKEPSLLLFEALLTLAILIIAAIFATQSFGGLFLMLLTIMINRKFNFNEDAFEKLRYHIQWAYLVFSTILMLCMITVVLRVHTYSKAYNRFKATRDLKTAPTRRRTPKTKAISGESGAALTIEPSEPASTTSTDRPGDPA